MDIQHIAWQASLTRQQQRQSFHVSGVITTPAERLGDGGYLVVYAATLQKDPQRNTDPAILILTLMILQQPATAITPSPQPTSWPVLYYVNQAGPEEEAYTTVRIFHEGTCIQEIRVPPC